MLLQYMKQLGSSSRMPIILNTVKWMTIMWLFINAQLASTSVSSDVKLPNLSSKISYPAVRRNESIRDYFNGSEIIDPYRWLEDPDSNETKAFIEAQNGVTESFIKGYPKRQLIRDRLKQVWNYSKYTSPERRGDSYYFYKKTVLSNYEVLYAQDSLDGEPRVLLDPNTLSDDGTVTVSKGQFSDDGRFYAFSLSPDGSSWGTIHLINTTTGEKLPDVLEKTESTRIAWTRDSIGFFYSWYPETGNESLPKLSYHKVGTPQSDDIVVPEFLDHPSWLFAPRVSDCGEYLFIFTTEDLKNDHIYFAKLNRIQGITNNLSLTRIEGIFEASYDYVGNDGKKAIFRTNKDAPNYKLVAIDLENFGEEKRIDLIPHHPQNVLKWAIVVDNDKLVICYVEDVKDNLGVYSLKSGKHLRQLPLHLGTVEDFSGDKRHSEIFYQVKSFLRPGTIYRVDLKETEEPKVFREVKINNFDASVYRTTQVFYSSKDGTKIPMFLVADKNIVLDGSSPALLRGYGAFGISIKPDFGEQDLVFLQHFKGVLAFSNIRGGGEYGESWHDGGRLLNKQNAFDDFISAAEYLTTNNYTSPKKLIIQGASNGGLVVGACINQRPDLFGAAIDRVGLMDMLRFHKLTTDYTLTSEYGSPDDPEQLKNLLKYSPLHNIRPPKNGGQYPATLLLAADHDDWIVPAHSWKHIATLQYEIGKLPHQTNPLMIRIDSNARHGGDKSTSKLIEEWTDIYTFILKTLNLEFK